MTGRYGVALPLDSYCHYGNGRKELFDRNWHVFTATCRLLARDGLKYSVNWQLGAEHPHVVIKASGKEKARKQKAAKVSVMIGSPLTPKQCAAKLQTAQRDLADHKAAFARKIREWRHAGKYYRRQYYKAETLEAGRKLGKALRIVHARNKFSGDLQYRVPTKVDYQTLDTAMGFRVPRLSELTNREAERGYFSELVRRYTSGRLTRGKHRRELPEPKPEDPADPILTQPWYKRAMQPKPLLREIEEARADVEFWREMELLSGQRERYKPGKAEALDTADDEVTAKAA